VRGDEGAFTRWMRFELDTLHAGLVSQRRPLADLLREAKPTAPARGGAHEFDVKELARLAAKLPTEARFALRLPMHLYVDSEVHDALYVMDPAVAEALEAVGVHLGQKDARERRWLARALALEVLRDWPTTVQFVYL
jgi:uncharacterized protein (UPF0216 family)